MSAGLDGAETTSDTVTAPPQDSALATERHVSKPNQARLDEMQARSERLRASMVALLADANALLSAGPQARRVRRR